MTSTSPVDDLFMNDNLANVTRTLRELLRTLPAVRARHGGEAHKRHLALIAHYQRRYDRLVVAG